jgi:hypothetical protein
MTETQHVAEFRSPQLAAAIEALLANHPVDVVQVVFEVSSRDETPSAP